MIEKTRDPKWVAIACTAIVVGGVAFKLFATSPDPATTQRRMATTRANPELGKYELAKSSWSSTRRATRPAKAEEKAELPTEIHERRWTGLCVAVQKDG